MPVVTVIIAVHVIVIFFYVVMYALFVLSVHVYYVNCNAKTQMGYQRRFREGLWGLRGVRPSPLKFAKHMLYNVN